MDETIPRQIYPVLLRAVTFLSHFMAPDVSGVYHLAPTASPEYPNGVPEDCNYTLSLFRWGVGTLREIERLLGEKSAQTEKLTRMEEHLCDYPGDTEQGFYIGKDLPYAQSHRHYSHLLMIYPLKLLDLSRPEERQMEERSLARWQSMPECLRGYSCTGAASISALLGKGNDALRYSPDFGRIFSARIPCTKSPGRSLKRLFRRRSQSLICCCKANQVRYGYFPPCPTCGGTAALTV